MHLHTYIYIYIAAVECCGRNIPADILLQQYIYISTVYQQPLRRVCWGGCGYAAADGVYVGVGVGMGVGAADGHPSGGAHCVNCVSL